MGLTLKVLIQAQNGGRNDPVFHESPQEEQSKDAE